MAQLAYMQKNMLIKEKQKSKNTLFLMSIPFVVFIFAIYYIPLFGWVLAFIDFTPGIPIMKSPFVGLANFKFMLGDSDILRVLRNTLVMSFLGIACSPFPVMLAIMLTEVRGKWFKKLVQTTTTLPYFISWIIVYSLAFSMFSSEGLVNFILYSLKISNTPVKVLGNADMIWIIMQTLILWKNIGWNAIIYLAAIAGIDSELFDAANIDGANRFKSILHVIVPGVAPTYLVLLLLSISTLLNTGLDQYLMFYNSIISDKIEVLDYYVYRMGIILTDYSYGTAVGMLKSIIAIILLFTVNAIAKRIRGDSII